MALHYPPAALEGVRNFYDFYCTEEEFNLSYEMALVAFAQPKPTCLLDYVLLWLIQPQCWRSVQLGRLEEHVFDVCPSYDSYLQSVLILSDLIRRSPDRFRSRDFHDKLGLAGITEVFPALSEEEQSDGQRDEDLRNRSWAVEYNVILAAQYEHPALRRETFEYWKHRWERSDNNRRTQYPS